MSTCQGKDTIFLSLNMLWSTGTSASKKWKENYTAVILPTKSFPQKHISLSLSLFFTYKKDFFSVKKATNQL